NRHATPPRSMCSHALMNRQQYALQRKSALEEQEEDDKEVEKAFDGTIIVRTSDLVPIWIWEADILRTHPALTEVCDRMLSLELWHYRQHCRETTPAEKQLLRDHEPYTTEYLTETSRGSNCGVDYRLVSRQESCSQNNSECSDETILDIDACVAVWRVSVPPPSNSHRRRWIHLVLSSIATPYTIRQLTV
ncbi:MAG: hypothetical protein Q7T57_04655, partial [Dehalococcoidales bacterium]|nr:hypothetical protein [Dehalococcoidales bacterium]